MGWIVSIIIVFFVAGLYLGYSAYKNIEKGNEND